MTDWIRNIVRMVRDELETQTRFGFYVGTVTNALQSFRRADVQPEWLEVDSESLEKLLRIASPILDVVYAVGTRVAVISQDGLPEAGAVLGAVTDDKQDGSARTVWIRADLEQHEGFIEIGGTKGVKIFVGTNPGNLTPVGNGDIEVEPGAAGFVLLGGSTAVSKLVKETFLTLFDSHIHTDPVSGTTGPPTILTSASPSGTYETAKVKGL